MWPAIGAAVLLTILGWAAVGLSFAGVRQSHGGPTEGRRMESRIQAPAVIPTGQEVGYLCPPIGTEGPPERDMPESKVSSGPAVGAALRCA